MRTLTLLARASLLFFATDLFEACNAPRFTTNPSHPRITCSTRSAALTDDALERAINPPPITVDLHDASSWVVADTLSKVAGQKFQTHGAFSSCTLDMRGTLWEIFAAINRQQPLSLVDFASGWLTSTSQPTPPHAFVKGYAVYIPMLYEVPDHAGKLVLDYVVEADRRINQVRVCNLFFTSIIDDTGRQLLPDESPANHLAAAFDPPLDRGAYFLDLPKENVQKIAKVQGELRLTVNLDAETLMLNDFRDQTFTIAGHRVAFRGFKARPGRIDFDTDLLDMKGTDFSETEPNPFITLEILDADGEIPFSYELGAKRDGARFSAPEFKPPLRLRVSAPRRTVHTVLPFEIKDIPLPGIPTATER